jgi:hypothetical protein
MLIRSDFFREVHKPSYIQAALNQLKIIDLETRKDASLENEAFCTALKGDTF